MNDPFEVSFFEDFFAFSSAEQESAAAGVVNPTGDALGVVRDAGNETIAEDGGLGAGDAKMVLDVGDGLLEVKRAELVADSDALLEGLVRSEPEELSQIRLTEQDQGQ